MKSDSKTHYDNLLLVAPHGGAWIEINALPDRNPEVTVAPHGGAWIEICTLHRRNTPTNVAPHGGAWIEIGAHVALVCGDRCRPSRRGVD